VNLRLQLLDSPSAKTSTYISGRAALNDKPSDLFASDSSLNFTGLVSLDLKRYKLGMVKGDTTTPVGQVKWNVLVC
jgi:hypothetical protein